MIEVQKTTDDDGNTRIDYIDGDQFVTIIHAENGFTTVSTNLPDTCPCCDQAQCYASCDGSQMGESDADAAGVAFESEDDIDERRTFNQTIDGIEALLMAMAGEGVDMNNEAIARAVFVAVEGAANNA